MVVMLGTQMVEMMVVLMVDEWAVSLVEKLELLMADMLVQN